MVNGFEYDVGVPAEDIEQYRTELDHELCILTYLKQNSDTSHPSKECFSAGSTRSQLSSFV